MAAVHLHRQGALPPLPCRLEGNPYDRGMTISELPIAIDREKLAALCRARGVRKLSLFGSVLRDDFDPTRSDVDVLVEYLPGRHLGVRHFGFQEELANMLGRKVDLCTPPMLSSYFRDDALSDSLSLYEQT